jgi:hypothetical protein
MVSILKRVVGRKREAVRVAASVQKGRALEDGELDEVVGGFGLCLPTVGPQALSLSTMTAGPNLSSGSLVGPLGLFPSTVSPGVGVGVVSAGTLSGGFSAFTGGGSDRGEP